MKRTRLSASDLACTVLLRLPGFPLVDTLQEGFRFGIAGFEFEGLVEVGAGAGQVGLIEKLIDAGEQVSYIALLARLIDKV